MKSATIKLFILTLLLSTLTGCWPMSWEDFEDTDYLSQMEAGKDQGLYIAAVHLDEELYLSECGYWIDGVWNEVYEYTNDYMVHNISIDANNVYITGYGYDCDKSIPITGYWHNGGWNNLAIPNISKLQKLFAASIKVCNGKTYIAGYGHRYEIYEDDDDPENDTFIFRSGYWVNGVWNTISDEYSIVSDIIIDSNHVYITGHKIDSGNYMIPGYWLDGTWNSPNLAGTSISGNMILDGGTVYQAGSYYNGSLYNPGYLAGTTWIQITDKLNPAADSEGSCIAKNNLDIYVGGYSIDSDGHAKPVYWLNGNLFQLSLPEGMPYGQVCHICVMDGSLYIIGNVYNEKDFISGYWKDGQWKKLELPAEYTCPNSFIVSCCNAQ